MKAIRLKSLFSLTIYSINFQIITKANSFIILWKYMSFGYFNDIFLICVNASFKSFKFFVLIYVIFFNLKFFGFLMSNKMEFSFLFF